MRSIFILGYNIYSQITVPHVTLPKAVLSTVEIFAVYMNIKCVVHFYFCEQNSNLNPAFLLCSSKKRGQSWLENHDQAVIRNNGYGPLIFRSFSLSPMCTFK